jgi:hypothetical protein
LLRRPNQRALQIGDGGDGGVCARGVVRICRIMFNRWALIICFTYGRDSARRSGSSQRPGERGERGRCSGTIGVLDD